MHFDITLIPFEVTALCRKFAGMTNQFENDLKSGIATDVAALFPGGAQLDQDMIAMCQVAIKSAGLLAAAADAVGMSARFQRLGSDLAMIEHDDEKHTISFYITSFEVVYHDLFGKL